MAQVVVHVIFTAWNPQTHARERHVLVLQRTDDPQAVAMAACARWSVGEAECGTLVDAVKQRWRDAVDKPVRKPKEATVHLLLQYYNDRYPPRQAELDAALRFNLHNPHVLQVHNFLEPGTVLPEWAALHPKMRALRRKEAGRFTFKQAFEYASASLPKGSTAVITNLDIYLDYASPWDTFNGDLGEWTHGTRNGSFSLALSRHEADLDGNLWRNSNLDKSAYAIAQDVWGVKTPIAVEDADYAIGNCPGSDNAIADRLARAGHKPLFLLPVVKVNQVAVVRQ
eukprot:TRINITY_DN20348_c0_g1_i3.p1 TRINITY_DN20348_c0_g1~~TRINITY_DN20348_c0_g1_i3.p1  ORF type:complete len:283 (-),score=66.80 TRINITY_DN20348_c0_g1_i3:93-941(-)